MKEGWIGDDYLVLFDEDEVAQVTARYGVGLQLPGHWVIGIRGWDDLIVRDSAGSARLVPTVPLDPLHMTPYVVPSQSAMKQDGRFAGKIKWYVQPLVFGGDPNAGPNVAWVTHVQHGELVAWWNAKYRELKAKGGAG
jgi:hypothetical protein